MKQTPEITQGLGEMEAQQKTLETVKNRLQSLEQENTLPGRGLGARMAVNALQDGIAEEDHVVGCSEILAMPTK